jgi:SIR2-like domain
MNNHRVYFIGAGASKQDRFPLTNELKHGIAWAIREQSGRWPKLTDHLGYLYHVQERELEASRETWEFLKRRTGEQPQTMPSQLPEVTDLLSSLDWMIREQSTFGPGQNAGTAEAHSSTNELALVRDEVVQALCFCLWKYCDLNAATTTRDFIKSINEEDALITTNWDLLLDAARDTRFGSISEDYGTFGNVVLENACEPQKKRPLLLKLHGSLSWRYCPRCQRLVIDPLNHVAGERVDQAICGCKCRFSELIVTPGFVREYRNAHLLNIWQKAMLTLATAPEWIFVGYSLPADDVGVRTLLLKARCMRHDLGEAPPKVTIVTSPDHGGETLARYRGIFRAAELDDGGFGSFVERMNAA